MEEELLNGEEQARQQDMEEELLNGEEQARQIATPVFVEEPEREIDLEEYEGVQTLAEAEEDAPHITDLQAVLRHLHPKYKNKRLDELLQSAAASRIFPDNFLDKNYLLVMSLLEEQEGEEDIDVVGTISMVQDGTSIGYEGRGRIEDLEVAGVAHEQEMERLTKDLGLT